MALGIWTKAAYLAEQTPEARNRYADYLRAVSILAVVFGHWLVAAPHLKDGALVPGHMLAIQPWTQWLTLLVQVMPIFFLVGGYSNAIAWKAARRDGKRYGEWLSARLQRLMLPVIPVLIFWIGLAVLSGPLGLESKLLTLASQAALVPTWFLAVYVMVAVMVPLTQALWQRLGMLSFFLFAAAAAAVDFAVLEVSLGSVGYLNYAFVWLAVHQLGYAWQEARITGPRAVLWAVAGAAAIAYLVLPGPYPLSMVDVPGEAFGNSAPPTLALLALGVCQTGIALSIERPMRRLLANQTFWNATVLVNGLIMTLYLWHMTAMILVYTGSFFLGGLGLAVEPGSGQWWALRPVWMGLFLIAWFPLLLVFHRYERATPEVRSVSKRRLVLGAALTCWGLFLVSKGGITSPGTLGVYMLPALLPLIGAGLASFGPLARWLGAAPVIAVAVSIGVACVPSEPREELSGCHTELDCGMGQICTKPTGNCSRPGECMVRPHICTREYRPVCGCDGQVYSNPCMAQAANMSIAREGECR